MQIQDQLACPSPAAAASDDCRAACMLAFKAMAVSEAKLSTIFTAYGLVRVSSGLGKACTPAEHLNPGAQCPSSLADHAHQLPPLPAQAALEEFACGPDAGHHLCKALLTRPPILNVFVMF